MNCTGCRYYHNLADNHCLVCDGSGYTRPSNADRIRAKRDEELAAWLRVIADCEGCPVTENFDECRHGKDCEDKWLEWLRREAKE